jgi:hypothetical protein
LSLNFYPEEFYRHIWPKKFLLIDYIFKNKIALVSWTEEVGLTLVKRDLNSMVLRTPENSLLEYDILQVFPFTSETKRMGIIIRV